MENYLGSVPCSCGKEHTVAIDALITGRGVVAQLPALISKYNAKKPFIYTDVNTYEAAGRSVCQLLSNHGISFMSYMFPEEHLEPDEHAVGSAMLHFDSSCDLIIAVGSGVLNDICKIVSEISGRPYFIVATAPSMDGYASATSSMARASLKTTINSRCPDVIIGDLDILKTAPEHMLKSGLGDMLAKYVSIAEWRIGHLITGEYYCEAVAQLIRDALKKCTDNAEGLLKREDEAILAVFEGLVIGGISMAYAGVSRPASGVEHYISHVFDMRGLSFETPVDLHGIQCAIATGLVVKLYEALKSMRPDAKKAAAYVASFDYADWRKQLKAFLGASADAMIALEAKEQKYDKTKHAARFAKIAENWDAILKILDEELPSSEEMDKLLDTLKIPKDFSFLGADKETTAMAFCSSKDIRNKYVLSHLAWDLGVLDDLCQTI